MGQKVLLGMSGGVDSSVAAALLLEQGYEVTGVTLKLRDNDSCSAIEGGCCSLQDVEDARWVAQKLGIPHYVFNYTELFEQTVIQDFVEQYRRGYTPNPCIVCNQQIKFSAMLRQALSTGFDYIATGHYAKVEWDADRGRFLLKRAPVAKDQSYVLYGLTQQQLAHTLFPLNSLPKDEIRRIAEKYQLPVAHKSDSQEICFVPDHDYASFIQDYTGETTSQGDFVDEQGTILGKHRGLIHYTVGQRKGLGIAFGKPMYVTRLEPDSNRVVLGEEGSQYHAALRASQLNLISMERLEGPMTVTVKIRYQATPAPAVLQPDGEGALVLFEQPQRAVTPGQAVVFYDEDIVVGGGVIDAGLL